MVAILRKNNLAYLFLKKVCNFESSIYAKHSFTYQHKLSERERTGEREREREIKVNNQLEG